MIRRGAPADTPPPGAEPPEQVALRRPRLVVAWLVVVLIAALFPVARAIVSRLAR